MREADISLPLSAPEAQLLRRILLERAMLLDKLAAGTLGGTYRLVDVEHEAAVLRAIAERMRPALPLSPDGPSTLEWQEG